MTTQCEDRAVLPNTEELATPELLDSNRSTDPRTAVDEFQIWYNEHQVHGAHPAHTLTEQMIAVELDPVRFTQRGGMEPMIQISRKTTQDDPKLFRLNIEIKEQERAA